MALSVAAEPVPFIVDGDGVARVGGTRVTYLDGPKIAPSRGSDRR